MVAGQETALIPDLGFANASAGKLIEPGTDPSNKVRSDTLQDGDERFNSNDNTRQRQNDVELVKTKTIL